MNQNTRRLLGKGRQSKITSVQVIPAGSAGKQEIRVRSVVGNPESFGSKVDSAAMRRKHGKKPMERSKT